MGEQLKQAKTWLYIAIWAGVPTLLCALIYMLTYIPNNNMPSFLSQPEYLLIIWGIIMFGFGYLKVDRFKDKYRRKNKKWSGALPQEIVLKANQIRTIPYVSALICIGIGLIWELVIVLVG